MLPYNPGGHAAYRDHVLTNLRKYYPDPSSLPKSTWDILEHFFGLDLSGTDILVKNRYSAYGPQPRLPSCMQRSAMLSFEFNINSVTEWVAALKTCPLYAIASGTSTFDLANGFAANGYEGHSPGHYSLMACFVCEVVMTMMFLFIIMGATHGKAPAGFAPLAIGLALTMIHLVSIPVTNTSVNPARSLGPALFVGGWALSQLWLFWVAPLIGGVLGGVLYRGLCPEPAEMVTGSRTA